MLRRPLLIPVFLLVGAFALATVIDLALAGWLVVGWMREAVGGNPGGGGPTRAEDVFWSALFGGGAALSVWVVVRAARWLRASLNGGSRGASSSVAVTVCVGAIAFVIQVWTCAVALLSG